MRDVHKVSFLLVPQLLNHLFLVSDTVNTSQVACTSGTSRVLTVASLKRLNMEALIPAPADCEVQSVIKFFNAQSVAPIEIHRQLCTGLSSHTARRSTHLLQEFSWKVFSHYPPYSPDLAPSDFHLFLHIKKFISSQH